MTLSHLTTVLDESFASENTENTDSNNQTFNLVCNLCCETFLDRKAIITHVLHCHNAAKERLKNTTKKSSKSLICPICNVVLCNKRTLDRHIAIHEGIKPYKCTKCDAKFARQDYLKRHCNTHLASTRKERYSCSTCGISYTEKCNLYKHVQRMHCGPKPYSCGTCKASFQRPDYLKRHLVRHSGEKTFNCTFCSTTFSDKSSLREHMSIHTGDKPFECSTCGATFRIRKILTRHELRHTGEKPFKCTECGTSFTRKYLLTDHMRKSVCEKCNKKFTCKREFRKHLKKHRIVDKLKKCTCNECSKQFKTKDLLQQHCDTHLTYICAICADSYRLKHLFVRHMKGHNEDESKVQVKSEPEP